MRARGLMALDIYQWGRGVLLAVFLLLRLWRTGQGAPRNLDSDFGDEGKVLTNVGDSACAIALVRQLDGKLVAAGWGGSDINGHNDFALVRYNANGSLDLTFRVGGKVTADFGMSAAASALVLQPDGKLVAFGNLIFGLMSSYRAARDLIAT